ncbi:MAG: TROVE domain-containing protein [Polyangiales bacterium]
MASRYASQFPTFGSQRAKARADQVRNGAGGFVFAMDPFARLERFLVLGVDGSTYYASERTLVLENAAAVSACLALDGARTVETIARLSESGRAPKNDPAIFALAIACGSAELATRRAALAAVPRVCRTGTHLFGFVRDVRRFRGFGRGLRRAIGGWYEAMPLDRLVFQVLKYGQRGGWSHRDLLRLAHPVPDSEERRALYRWVTGGGTEAFAASTAKGPAARLEALPEAIVAFEALRAATTENDVVDLVRAHRFTHEMLPSRWKRSARVWEALLPEMPTTALLRGLAQLTSVGLLAPGAEASRFVANRLVDSTALVRARVHPLAVLAALKVYAQGRGERGKLSWSPVPSIVTALDEAFELAFRAVVPSRKRFRLALDVSGSMEWGSIAGMPGLSPRLASAAMAMATLRTEPSCEVLGFSHELVRIPIRASDRLDHVLRTVSAIPMGATDCALPILHATKSKTPVDVFVVYTDNETWFGSVHPYQALLRYREATGIPAKLAVVGMTATNFTIADPTDPFSLDFVGFDAAAPAVLSDFARA